MIERLAVRQKHTRRKELVYLDKGLNKSPLKGPSIQSVLRAAEPYTTTARTFKHILMFGGYLNSFQFPITNRLNGTLR